MSKSLGEFKSVDAAFDALVIRVDDMCIDNYRFAYVDDAEAMVKYNEQIDDGCCGSADINVTINGRLGWIGCNYGH